MEMIEVNDIVNVRCLVIGVDRVSNMYDFLALESENADRFWLDGDVVKENVTLIEKGPIVTEPNIGYVLVYPRGYTHAAVWRRVRTDWMCTEGEGKPMSWDKLVSHAKNNDLVIEEITEVKRLV